MDFFKINKGFIIKYVIPLTIWLTMIKMDTVSASKEIEALSGEIHNLKDKIYVELILIHSDISEIKGELKHDRDRNRR